MAIADANRQEHEAETYPNACDDPPPPPPGHSQSEQQLYDDRLTAYTSEMLEAYRESDMHGAELWNDLLTAFRPYAIRSCSRAQVATWTYFLSARGIYIDKTRDRSRWTALVELLYRPQHIPAAHKGVQLTSSTTPQYRHVCDNMDQRVLRPATVQHNPEPNYTPTPQQGPDTNTGPENNTYMGMDMGERRMDASPDIPPSTPTHSSSEENSDHQPGVGKDDREKKDADKPNYRPANQWDGPERTRDDATVDLPLNMSIGVQGLMRAYQRKTLFSGTWDENFTNCLKIFDTLASMCNLTPQAKLTGMPVMISANAFDFYAEHEGDSTSY